MMSRKSKFIIAAVFGWLIGIILLSCGPVKIAEPVRWEKEPVPCFRERYCNYQNQNNPDKSYCNKWATDCNKLLTFEYCRKSENRVLIKVQTRTGLQEGDDFFAGCWTILK